jgi:hypothetical protein
LTKSEKHAVIALMQLERAENLDVQAYTSVIVMTEVLHKLMIAEAVEKFGIRPYKVSRFFKNYPDAISSLTKCEDSLDAFIR